MEQQERYRVRPFATLVDEMQSKPIQVSAEMRKAVEHRFLGTPIKGDRLYGCVDVRLFLHAERLTVHLNGARRTFESPAPF